MVENKSQECRPSGFPDPTCTKPLWA